MYAMFLQSFTTKLEKFTDFHLYMFYF